MLSRISSVVRLSLLLMLCAAFVGCSESAPPPVAATNANAQYGGYGEPGDEGSYDSGTTTDDPYAGGYGDGYGDPDDGPENRDGYDSDPYAATEQGAATGSADGYASGYGSGYGDSGYANAPAGTSDSGYGDGANTFVGTGGSGMYATQIEPLFKQHCYSCHGGGDRASKGDLVLNSPQAIQGAGIIETNDPDESELLIRISMEAGEKGRMPPKGPGLSEEEVALVRTWIQQGASAGGGGGGGDGYGDYASAGAAGGYGDGYGNGYADGGRGDGEGGYDQRGGGELANAAPAPPKNLAESASRSFQRGDDLLAMNQLHAQALVQSDAAATVLAKYQWVPALKRPKLAVRWGIGVKYYAKGGFEGAPRPVGVNQDIPGLDSGNDADEFEPVIDFRNAALDYYAGKVGEELVLRLQGRIERAYYGDVLREALEARLAGPSDDREEDFDSGYGDGFRGGGGYGGDGYGTSSGGGGSSREKPENVVEQIMPGVTMLGVHTQSDLLEMAADHQLDLLLMLDIVVDRNFTAKLVTNSTKVRLFDVASGDSLAVTRSLKNVDIQRELAKDPDDNRIIREVDKIFNVADAEYKTRPFPTAAKPEHAIRFVKNLLATDSANPLWKLSEVKFYQSRGLLLDEHAASAFKRIAPEQASKLVSVADDEQMKTMFASLLTSELAGSEDPEEGGDGDRPRSRREFR